MTDRTVKVDLVGNVRQYTRSVDEAARSTDKLNRKAKEFDGKTFISKMKVSTGEAYKTLRDFRAHMAQVAADDRAAKVKVDMTEAMSRLKAFGAELRDMEGKQYSPEIELKVARARSEFLRLKTELEQLGAMKPTPEVNAKINEASAKINVIREQLQALNYVEAAPEVTADTSVATERVRSLRADLSRLDFTKAEPTAELKANKIYADVMKIEADLTRLGAMAPSPEVDLEIGEASAKAAVLREMLQTFDGRTFRAKAEVDTKSAVGGVSALLSAVFAIGPAAVTAGVVGAGAIGGMTTSLTVAAAAAATGALAFSGIGDAVKAMNDYALDPSKENLKKLNEAMGQLTMTGQAFARQLMSLKPALDGLKATAQNGLLPGAAAGLRELTGILPNVQNLVGRTAEALGRLAQQGGAALNSPFWKNYINFMAAEAGPTLQSFGNILGNLIKGFAGMQMAFKPVSDMIISGLESMAQSFSKWATTLDSNQGFQQFIDYVVSNGPKLMDTIGSIGRLLGTIVEAAAPIGPVALQAIKGLAEALNAVLSVPGLGTGLVAIASGLGAINLAMRAVNAVKLSALAQGLGLVGTSGGKAAAGAKTAAGGVSTLGGMLGIFNPRANAAALQSTKLGTRLMEAGGKTATMTRGITTAAGALPVLGAAFLGAYAVVGAYTKSTDAAAGAMLKGGAAAREMSTHVEAQTATLAPNAGWIDRSNTAISNWIKSNIFGVATVDSMNQEIQAQLAAMSPLERAQTLAAQAQNNYNDAVARHGAGSIQARNAMDQLNVATREQMVQQLMAENAISRSTAEQMAGAMADQARRQTMAAVGDAQKAYNAALAQHGPMSAQARDAELALSQAQIQAANAARNGSDGNRQYALTLGQMAQQSKGNLTPALSNMISELDMTGISAIGATVRINNVGQAVATLPNGKEVVLKADGTNAQVQLEAVTTTVNRLPAGKTINVGAIGAQAESVLANIGFQVTRLPDGSVEVTAKDEQAKATLTAFVNYSNAIKANPKISVDPKMAYDTMLRFINEANAQTGRPQLQANTAPADQAVNAAIQHYNSLTGTGTLDANTDAANQRTSAWVAQANAARGTATVDALTGPASDRVRDWAAQTAGQRPTPNVDANTAPAMGASWQWNAATQRLEPVPAVNANTGPATGQTNAWDANTAGRRPTPNIFANGQPATQTAGDWDRYASGLRPRPSLEANDAAARGTVRSFSDWVSAIRLTVSIIANKIGFSAGGIATPMAKGGIVNAPPIIPNDDGNALAGSEFAGKKLRRMPNTGARMVAPNSWRVVGDRMDVPELYAPLDGSGRSLSLIDQGARTFGYRLIEASAVLGNTAAEAAKRSNFTAPRPVNVPKIMAQSGVGGAKTTNNYVTVHNPIAERASDSVQRELSKMADLGLFGND